MKPPACAAAFYRELREFVSAEMRAQRTAFTEALEADLTRRLNLGRCVEGVHFKGTTPDGALRFECNHNESDFREGDMVRLHRGNPFDPIAELPWMGDGVLDDLREFILLGKPWKGSASSLERGVPYTLDASFIDLSPQFEAALDELGQTERGRERILPLLMGLRDDEPVDPESYDAAANEAESEGFNPSQQDAIADGVAAELCSLIQGPPGTGKTRVLAQIVKQRVARGERVLVTACAHRAIHEALRAIHRAMPGFDRIVKIGGRIDDPGFPVRQYDTFADTPFVDEAGAYVIGATPFAARSKRLRTVEFEAVLIDEASQMTLPLAVMAMLSANTYIIIGDPRQLPPVVRSQSARTATDHSLFGRLGHRRQLIRLNTTYRMNEPIGEWISYSFYAGRLACAEGARGRRLHLSGEASAPWLAETLAPENSLVWITTSTTNTRHYSMEEAALVTQIVGELFRRGLDLAKIGIVTPFRRQARIIRRRLRQSLDAPPDLTDLIVVDTVERMQGQEREVIIISTAASDAGFIGAISEFLYLPQRLNVAASRAQSKVITLASESFLTPPGADTEWAEEIAHWRSLRAASRAVSL